MLLAKSRSMTNARGAMDGPTLAEVTGLSVNDINDAVSLLHASNYVEWVQFLDTVDYDFAEVWITSRGRYEVERVSSALDAPLDLEIKQARQTTQPLSVIALPPTPVGSPYGFSDGDWEYIAQQKSQSGRLTVVMGYQFDSKHYDSPLLRENIKVTFQSAVNRYNAQHGSIQTELEFRPLAAGYGEHLFNEIARDIIASDIAVFDTSDLNPNVMVELGVALTWGVRVLPIKAHSQSRPPSDISGQTWADYEDSARVFLDSEHNEKLVRMVERAVVKKGRPK